MKLGTKIGLTVLVIFCAIFMSGGLYVYSSFSRMSDVSKTTGFNNEEEIDIEDLNLKEVEGITNVLLVGVDDRGEDDSVRADALMIATIDSVNNKLKLTSLMRDTLVNIPGKGETKLTHAHAYGGMDTLIKTVESNFQIDINKYVKINFDGFKDVVNTIGGVEVNIEDKEELNELNRCLLLERYENPNFKDEGFRKIVDGANLLLPRDEGAKYLISENPHISKGDYDYIAEKAEFVEKTGYVNLNGAQTLAYSRMRHSTNGSYGRTERQRNVISLIANEIKDIPVTKYISLAESIIPHIKTNISMTEGLNLGYTAIKINNFNIEQLQIPPTKLSEGLVVSSDFIYENMPLYVFVMDKENAVNVMHNFIFEDIVYDESKYNQFYAANAGYYSSNNNYNDNDSDNEDSWEDNDSDGNQNNNGWDSESDSSNESNDSNESNGSTDSSDGNSSDTESNGGTNTEENTDSESGGESGEDNTDTTPDESVPKENNNKIE